MKNRDMKNKRLVIRHSIKTQITIVFVSIMAFTIIACLLINMFFLEKYYESRKQSMLLGVYNSIEEESVSGDMTSDEFDVTLQKYSETYNVSIVIITSLFQPIKIYATEPQDRLLMDIELNVLGGKVAADKIIDENENYILIQKHDNRTQTDYIEMWGMLPNGSFFLLRTALESVRVSAEIANRFFLYIGLGAVLVSAFFIYFFTRKISKPILDIASISEKMSNMDFDTKYEGKSKTEIGVLGNSINRMSDNLEDTIKKLKEANEELKKDNDLKTQIDEMRKEFISNVSHELKTPIALIQGYSEGLKEGINEAEERDYYCDVIIDEASKMNKMVKQLLNLNQIESGADMIQKENFDIAQLIKNYIQSAEILTSQQDIKVNMYLDEDCVVYADEFKIEEVFMNYFSNACNHCESETEKRIDVYLKKEENKVRVSVFNTGKAIPIECIDHIWEKFYKVDKARTREYGGSGVGLSIVKAIIDAHGGEVGVANTSEGVLFWFTL